MQRFLNIVASIALGAAVALPGVVSANDEVMALSQDPNNWVMWGRTYDGQRYSPLNQITKENVGDLQVAWTFSTGVLRGHEGGPLVIGDTMWVHTPFPNKVFSINLPDQSINWIYEPKQDAAETVPVMCCDTVYRGLAYADGKIFLQQANTVLVALDANTGERLWSTVNGDPKKGETNTNAPIVVGDKVYTGISGGEFGVRGFLAAYNINDGSLVWKAYSTGPDDEMLIDPENTMSLGKPVGPNSSLKTWKGDQWMIGGGTTWGWYTYDPELNLVYYGTGNPSTWN
ncbi:MAG: PQQ-binding-like beta-propeller repeat protein, partial [Chromatiales bacterium]|nr:PQQ-binding-like beta-propeller repeat protein [Chromatiales bacterium]